MSSDAQDIRQWARDHGINLASKGRIGNDIREQYQAATAGNGDAPPPGDAGDGDGDGDLPDLEVGEADLMPPGGPDSPAEPPAPPDASSRVAERPPRPQPRPRKRRGLLQRDKTAAPKAGKGKPAPRRVSVAGLVSGAWTLGSYMAARSERAIPLARCLDMQSAVAGPLVEDMIAGTVVDRVLQPLARMGASGRKGAALLGLPAAVGIVTVNPELYPVAKPVMRLLLMDWFELAGPAMEKAQQRAEKLAESLQGLDLDAMLDSFWAGLPVPTQESPDEEAAVRRARGE